MTNKASSEALEGGSPPPDASPTRRRARGGLTVYILRRVGLGLVTLLVISVVVFAATQALPGDAAQAILGRNATPASVEALRTQLGLDQPVWHQYASWLGSLLRGDLGVSVTGDVPVSQLLGDRVVNSLTLVALVSLIAIPASLLIGAYAAVRRDGLFDASSSLATLVLAAIPEFIVGIGLIVFFATSVLHVLPAVTFLAPGEAPWSNPRQLVLPVATLVVAVVPYITRLVRSSMIEVLQSEYVEMARLKGLRERDVAIVHAGPNALGPALQAIALTFSYLAGGIVVVEYLFNYPGIGQAFQSAVAARDVPTIQVIAILIASVYIIANIVADVLTILATPRLRTRLGSRR
ncbi:MAG: ABC transporter permease [Gaiellales bacterium]